MRMVLSLITAIGLTAAAAAQSCTGRLEVFTKLIDHDLKTGFVGKSVHTKMTAELTAASAACNAGDDGKAQALISATQSRHGYPVR